MSNWKHFTEAELACRHCGASGMNDEFMQRIEWARENCDFGWIVNSAYRCPAHDAQIGGGGNHPTGKAMDIRFTNSHQLFVIVRELIQQHFRRIGIDFKNRFIHVDCVEDRPDEVLWGY